MTRYRMFLAITAVSLLFASCQQFFTTSLASGLKRDPASLVPSVSSSNAEEVAELVSDDRHASLKVLEGLSGIVANSSGAERVNMAVLALSVSSNASGVAGSLMGSEKIINTVKDGDLNNPTTKTELFNAIDEVLAGLDTVDSSANTLVEILQSGVPLADVVANAKVEDIAMAAIVLMAQPAKAMADSGGIEAYVTELGNKQPGDLSDSENLAKELATLARDKYTAEGGTGPLPDLLNTLKL